MLQDTEQLQVQSTLPVLAFNFDSLKAWAEGLAARHADLVVTEEAIADVKRDMAELNKNKSRLETARKEAVRRVSEPIRAFEAQIKEIVGIFDVAYSRLGAQVKVFEDAQREERRNKVKAIIEGKLTHEGLDISIPIREKWLNKSTTAATIKAEIEEIFARHYEEEQRRKALEQARQDRAAAVESHVKGLNQRHGLDMPLARFMGGSSLDMNIPLEQVLRGIDGVFNRAVELRELEKEKPVPAAAPEPAVTGKTRAMSIVLEYDVANEVRVKSCLETLKTLCVGFGARYRQE